MKIKDVVWDVLPLFSVFGMAAGSFLMFFSYQGMHANDPLAGLAWMVFYASLFIVVLSFAVLTYVLLRGKAAQAKEQAKPALTRAAAVARLVVIVLVAAPFVVFVRSGIHMQADKRQKARNEERGARFCSDLAQLKDPSAAAPGARLELSGWPPPSADLADIRCESTVFNSGGFVALDVHAGQTWYKGGLCVGPGGSISALLLEKGPNDKREWFADLNHLRCP